MALSNLAKLRTKLSDSYRPFAETFQGDGQAVFFDLQHYPVQSGTYSAWYGASALNEPTSYSLSVDDGRITMAVTASANSALRFVGKYSTFSDTELESIMGEAGLTTGATAATWAALDVPLLTCVEILFGDSWKRHSWGAAGGQNVNEAGLMANLEKWRAMLIAKYEIETGPQGGLTSWAENAGDYGGRYSEG
jgi:hypothetical protein